MHSCQVFWDPHSLSGTLQPGSLSYPLTLHQCTLSQECSFSWILFGCWDRCGGVWMIGSPPTSSAVSTQMELKHGFWLGNLKTEWWKETCRGDPDTSGETNLMNDTYPASGASANRSSNTPRGGANNFRLECRVRWTVYIDVTNINVTNHIPWPIWKKWHWPSPGMKASGLIAVWPPRRTHWPNNWTNGTELVAEQTMRNQLWPERGVTVTDLTNGMNYENKHQRYTGTTCTDLTEGLNPKSRHWLLTRAR